MADNPYKNPLILTTPHVRGQKVRNAQYMLAGHNAWHDNPNPIRPYAHRLDGEFGPYTAGAVVRAKFLLGYPQVECDHRFGYLVYNLLKGEAHLSSEFADRRRIRLDAEDDKNSIKLKALRKAETYIGTKESPFGSNHQMFGEWYGMNGVPWCCIFISYNITHSGRPWKHSYVPDVVEVARRGKEGMSITFNPEPGDLVCYHNDSHIAFFYEWTDSKHSRFNDLGGNTGPIDMSNGGEVLKQSRDISMVSHFVRLHF